MRAVPHTLAVIAMLTWPLTWPGQAQTQPIPQALIEDGLKKAECDLPYAEAIHDAREDDLGGGLKLYEVSCWRWAYNFGSILFAFDPATPAHARLLRFKIWEDNGFAERYGIPFPTYDAEGHTLTTWHKYRGPGDCGHSGKWRWTGSDFEMTDYWRKANCDGELFEPVDENRIFPSR